MIVNDITCGCISFNLEPSVCVIVLLSARYFKSTGGRKNNFYLIQFTMKGIKKYIN